MFTPFLEDSITHTNYSNPPNYFRSCADNFVNYAINVNDKELLLWCAAFFKTSSLVLVCYWLLLFQSTFV